MRMSHSHVKVDVVKSMVTIGLRSVPVSRHKETCNIKATFPARRPVRRKRQPLGLPPVPIIVRLPILFAGMNRHT